MDKTGLADPYVKVTCGRFTIGETDHRRETLNPMFYETLGTERLIWLPESHELYKSPPINVQLYDWDRHANDELIGQAFFWCADAYKQSKSEKQSRVTNDPEWHSLMYEDETRGKLLCSFVLERLDFDKDKLTVKLKTPGSESCSSIDYITHQHSLENIDQISRDYSWDKIKKVDDISPVLKRKLVKIYSIGLRNLNRGTPSTIMRGLGSMLSRFTGADILKQKPRPFVRFDIGKKNTIRTTKPNSKPSNVNPNITPNIIEIVTELPKKEKDFQLYAPALNVFVMDKYGKSLETLVGNAYINLNDRRIWRKDKALLEDVVTLEQVRGLPYDTIVLGVGGAYMKGSGEFMKACPYSASVEMAMCDMQIPYKLIQTHLLALEKEPWFVALHPKGKPSTPMLWSHGRWIFDTLPILDELMRRYPERQHHAVHVLKENCDARGTLRSGPMTKFAGSVDGSAEESQQRVALENALRPFVDRLTQGKYLGGDTLSFSDCHFSQQLASAAGLVHFLKGVDIIGERPILKAYYERLWKLPCYKQSRGPNAIRDNEFGIRELERDYSEQCAIWCVKKWKLSFANLRDGGVIQQAPVIHSRTWGERMIGRMIKMKERSNKYTEIQNSALKPRVVYIVHDGEKNIGQKIEHTYRLYGKNFSRTICSGSYALKTSKKELTLKHGNQACGPITLKMFGGKTSQQSADAQKKEMGPCLVEADYHGRGICPFHNSKEENETECFDIFSFTLTAGKSGPIPVNPTPLPLEVSLNDGFTESIFQKKKKRGAITDRTNIYTSTICLYYK